ncbi:flagellar hook-length control protein FliK [Aquabacter sp. CN5-332]|uniref:flagellar hook-length control protein FliK n=1 Tax=Aquabacter sp. CN5-332 TaxID=3156608 RepID=UPI0032B4D034
MSALEVERQSQSIGAAGRSGAKTVGGFSGGQGSKDEASAFGALLDGLGDAPRGVENVPEGAKVDSGAETEPSLRTRMSALFSALGVDAPAPEEKASRLPVAKNQKDAASEEPSPHAVRERGAASEGTKRGPAHLLGALSPPDSKAGRPQDTIKTTDAGNRHGVSGAGQKGDEESGQPALAADPRLAQATPDATAAAMAAMPVTPPQPKPDAGQEGEARLRGGAPGTAPQSAEEEGEGKAAGPAPIRITVLSRETHFAPVREANLPGTAQSAQPFALPGSATGASPTGEVAGGRQHERAKEIASEGAEDDAAERVERRLAGRSERHEEVKPVAARDGGAATRRDVEGRAADRETPASTPASGSATATGNTQQWMATAQQGLPLSNLRQVSDAIGAEIARMTNPAAAAAGDLARAQGPVRLLDIQLNPSDLGIVTVRLRSSASGLEVKLQASNPETARLLKQDQARLAEMLRSEGVEAADVSVVDGSDGGAAWTRFEMTPRQPLAAMPAARQGEGQDPSDQRQGGDSSRNGRNGDEDASDGGNRPGRDRG